MQNTATNYPLHDYYSKIYKRYDLVNRLFTFGLDKKWRREAAIRCLEFNPKKVIDLCCGTGDLVIAIKKSSGSSTEVVGFDFNESMLKIAREKALKTKVGEVEFVKGDAVSIPFASGIFDCMTIGFGFRNLTFDNDGSVQYLREMHRILKTGGHILILESSVPTQSIIRFYYTLYLKFILVPLGGLITGNWRAYNYLVRSTLSFFSLTDLKELLIEYRFRVISVQQFFLGTANLIIAVKE